jgi:cytochrome c553
VNSIKKMFWLSTVAVWTALLCAIAITAKAQEVDFSSVKAKWNTCAACHGNEAQGKPGFPSLNWMEEDYIVEALTDYKQMINRGDMSGIMFGQAATLTDEEVVLMAKYIKELKDD